MRMQSAALAQLKCDKCDVIYALTLAHCCHHLAATADSFILCNIPLLFISFLADFSPFLVNCCLIACTCIFPMVLDFAGSLNTTASNATVTLPTSDIRSSYMDTNLSHAQRYNQNSSLLADPMHNACMSSNLSPLVRVLLYAPS